MAPRKQKSYFQKFKWAKLKTRTLNFASKLPLLEGLPDCTRENYYEAFKEVFSNVLFSTMPIWLSFFAFIWKSADLKTATNSILGHGELLMYATSILAPIFYMVFKNFDTNTTKKFPGAFSHIILVTVIFVICSFAFGVLRSESLPMDTLFYWSLSLYIISLILIYLATVFSNSRPRISYNQVINNEGAEMTAQLGRHR